MTTTISSCSKCGFQSAAGMKFCPNCGGAMVFQPMAATAAASAPGGSTIPPPPFATATMLCGKCGTEFMADVKFCPACGTRAGSAPPPHPEGAPRPIMVDPFLCSRCRSPIVAGTNFCPICGNSAGLGIAGQASYAGFGVRVVADLIDTLVLILTFGILELVPILDLFVPVTILMSVIVTALYGAITESSVHQASLGKRAMGLKVTDLEGNRISLGTGFVRWIIETFPIFGLVSCLVVAFTQKKQGIHDLIAGTLVWRSN